MQPVRAFTSSVLAPYERGAELGHRFATEVSATVASYRRLFDARSTEPFDLDLWGQRAWDRITHLDVAMADEIRGIAAGSDVPVAQVAALNARTELLAVIGPPFASECSTVVSLPDGAAPVAVQTWDWYDAMAANWFHWTIPHPDGHVVETVTEFGVLGKIGVSSQGVGVLFNMLHHADDATTDLGYPVHLLSRKILDSAQDLDEAVVLAKEARVSASSALTVVDGGPTGGRAASLEMFPVRGPGVVQPEDGILVRTNHFLSDAGRNGCLANRIGPGTRIRQDKLCARLDGQPPHTAAEVVTAMRDHADIGGVCAHPDRSLDPVLQHATLATVELDVGAGTLRVQAGGPCGGLISSG